MSQHTSAWYVVIVSIITRADHLQSKYIGNHWSLTKFCVAQFKGGFTSSNKAEEKRVRDAVVKARSFDDVAEIAGSWTGEEDFQEIARAIESRSSRGQPSISLETETTEDEETTTPEAESAFFTPEGTQNPEPPSSRAPRLAIDELPRNIPAMMTGEGPLTPTPGGGIIV